MADGRFTVSVDAPELERVIVTAYREVLLDTEVQHEDLILFVSSLSNELMFWAPLDREPHTGRTENGKPA